MRKIFIILFFLFVFFSFSFSQKEEIYVQSSQYLYNWKIEKAIIYLEDLKEREPENLMVYWRLSYLLAWEVTQRGGEKGIEKKEREKLFKKFDEIFKKGLVLSDSYPNNSRMFYKGGLFVHRVFFKIALGEKKSLKKDVEEGRKCFLKIKPGEEFYWEAQSYLGIANYIPVLLSSFHQKLLRIYGYQWNQELGLKQIRQALKYSRYQDDLKDSYLMILETIILKEKNGFREKIPEAIKLAGELLKKYPNHFRAKLTLIICYWKKGELVKAKKIGEELFEELKKMDLNNSYIKYLYRRLAKIETGIEREIEKRKK